MVFGAIFLFNLNWPNIFGIIRCLYTHMTIFINVRTILTQFKKPFIIIISIPRLHEVHSMRTNAVLFLAMRSVHCVFFFDTPQGTNSNDRVFIHEFMNKFEHVFVYYSFCWRVSWDETLPIDFWNLNEFLCKNQKNSRTINQIHIKLWFDIELFKILIRYTQICCNNLIKHSPVQYQNKMI